jgi:hypothetical protein
MSVAVVSQPHPFNRRVHRFDVAEGTSVLDIVEALEIPERFHSHVEVRIGEHAIPVENWHRVRPRAGAAIAIRIVPQGGGGSGGGGKNVLASILMLAVLVIATVVAGPIASSILGAAGIAGETAILGTTITAFTLTKAVVAATIMMVGGLLVNALVPPPKQEGNAVGQRALITGVQNRLVPYGTVPRIIGKRRVYPMLAARPYTEAQGPLRFLRILLAVGMGPLAISDIKIGETPIGVFTNITTEIKEGWTTNAFGALPPGKTADTAPTLFTSRVRETGVNALLTHNVAVTRTTLTETSEISIDVDAPIGLASYDGKQRRLELTILVAVEWRAVGAGSWTSVVWDGNDTADGTQTNGVLTLKDATATGTTRGGRWKVPAPGQYEVRLTRTTVDYNSPSIVERTVWSIMRSIAYEDPVTLPGMALLALRIQVTDQFQGMPDSINCVAESYLPVWDGAAWAYEISRNPAWGFADLFRRRFTEARIGDDRLNLAVLKDWADACDAPAQGGNPTWEVNAVLEGGSVFDAARVIASHGRANFSVVDGKYAVVRDAPQATPVQLISPRNSWGYRGSKPFIEFPHALRVQFVNAAKGWQDDQVVAYDDGYDELTATRYETLQLVHCTDADQAWREGRYNLAVGRLRPEEHTVSMDIEALRCTAGDRVELSHDVISVGLGAARITGLVTSGSNITALQIDATFSLVAAVNYSIRVRLETGATVLLNLAVPGADTETRTLTLASSTPIAGGPDVGDLLVFGVASAVTIPCIVKRILPGADLSARLVLAPYSSSIYSSDTGTIPAFNSLVTVETDLAQMPPADPVFTLASDETALEQLSDGTLQDRIVVWIETPASSRVSAARYEVQWRRSADGAWHGVAPVDPAVRVAFISPVTQGQDYDVRVRAVSATGIGSAWVVEAAHTVVGKTTVPAGVAGFAAVNAVGGVQLTWTANPELDVAGYSIRRGASWAAGAVVAEVVKATGFFVGLDQLDTGRTFWIKAVDVIGLESTTAATATATGTPINMPTGGTVGLPQLDALTAGLLIDLPKAISADDVRTMVLEKIARAKADQADQAAVGGVANQLVVVRESVRTLTAQVDGANASFTDTVQLLATTDLALADRATALQAQLSDTNAAAVTAYNTAATGSAADLAAFIFEKLARRAADVANISQIGGVANQVVSVAAKVEEVRAQADGATASVRDDVVTVATATTAVAARTSTLETSVNDPSTGLTAAHNRISTEQIARSDGDSAIASSVTALDASFQSRSGEVAQAKNELVSVVASGISADLLNMIKTKLAQAAGDRLNAAQIGSLVGQIVSLSQQILTLRAETSGGLATFGETITVISTAQIAQASQIVDLSAQTAAGTASGSVRFVVASAPSGVTARYAIEVRTSTGPDVFAKAGLYLDVIGSASKITIAADDVMANTNAFTVSNPVIRNSVPIEIRQQWLTISKTPVGYGAVVNMTGFLGVSPDAAFFDGTTYLSGNPTQINASSANRDGSSLWGELAVRVDTLDDQVVFRGDGTGYVRRPAVGGGFTTYDMGQLFSPIALNPLLLGYTLGDVWKCPPGELAIRGYTGAFMAIGAALPFRVPAGATNLVAKLWGGGGGGGDTGLVGGPGHFHGATIPVVAGEWLWLIVGGPG